MRPRERRDSGQSDLFKARLDQIVDLNHPLAKLASTVDWRFPEERFGAVYSDRSGQPPLPTRLMAGLAILKHMHDLSDEVLCERWIENPYYQLFCDGMDGPGACAMLALDGLTSKGIRYVHHRNHWAGYREERVSGSWRRGRQHHFSPTSRRVWSSSKRASPLISGRGRSAKSGMKCG